MVNKPLIRPRNHWIHPKKEVLTMCQATESLDPDVQIVVGFKQHAGINE